MTEHPTDVPWLNWRDLRVAAAATIAAALLTASWPAPAQDGSPGRGDRRAPATSRDAPSIQAFTQRMRALFPATRIDEVRATETPGLFEVVMGPNLAYIDGSGRYWTFGHRYDMVERRDITAPRLAALDKVDTASLPVDAAIKSVRGNGRRVLHVFADPNCGYCRQLERSLSQLDDLTVYTYLLPILSQDSADKAAAIWCSAQPEAAWRAWMLDGAAPTRSADCATPTDKVSALAKRLRIQATPTLIAADGRKAPGAMPAEELSAWLDAGSAAAASRAASVRAPVAAN